MKLTQILNELIARSVSAEVIAAICNQFSEFEALQREMAVLADMRAKNATRQRRHYEKTKHHNVSLTSASREVSGIESSSSSSSEIQKKERKKESFSRKTRLPEGFTADLGTRLHGSALGFSEQGFDRHVDEFLMDARANGRMYVDWQQALRKWLTAAAPGGRFYRGNDNGGGRGNGFHRKTTRELGDELVAELRQREAETERGGAACDADANGLPGQRGLFEGLPRDAGGSVVPISAARGGSGSKPDSRGSERMQIIPPNGRANF